MTPDREKNMRLNLAEFSQEKLANTCIELQDVIDTHVNEKSGMRQQVTALGIQVPALQQKVAELEAEAEGTSLADPEEIKSLQQQVSQLTLRVSDLQGLNEGLQKKLIG